MKEKYGPNDFYTVGELSEILGLTRLSIYRYVKSKKLKAHKFGNELRVLKDDFQAFLDTHSTTKN